MSSLQDRAVEHHQQVIAGYERAALRSARNLVSSVLQVDGQELHESNVVFRPSKNDEYLDVLFEIEGLSFKAEAFKKTDYYHRVTWNYRLMVAVPSKKLFKTAFTWKEVTVPRDLVKYGLT